MGGVDFVCAQQAVAVAVDGADGRIEKLLGRAIGRWWRRHEIFGQRDHEMRTRWRPFGWRFTFGRRFTFGWWFTFGWFVSENGLVGGMDFVCAQQAVSVSIDGADGGGEKLLGRAIGRWRRQFGVGRQRDHKMRTRRRSFGRWLVLRQDRSEAQRKSTRHKEKLLKHDGLLRQIE